MKLYDIKSKDLHSPYRLSCSNKNCKKKLNVKTCSFFKLHQKIPCSVTYSVIIKFILKKKLKKNI